MNAKLAGHLRRLADRLAPPPAEEGDWELTASRPISEEQVPLQSRRFRGSQSEAAIQVMGEAVEGFLLFVLTPDEPGDDGSYAGTIAFSGSVPNDAWPGFIEAMNRVKLYSEEHGEAGTAS